MNQSEKSAMPDPDAGQSTRPKSPRGDCTKNLRMVLTLADAGVEMAFRKITKPQNGFLMGERGYYDFGEPVHRVLLASDFWLGETPVTQKQFSAFTEQLLKSHKNNFVGKLDHPATNMTYTEAIRFCAWLGEQCSTKLEEHSIKLVALPTEAEWEYACRAGTETEYYTGDGPAALDAAGWFEDNSNRSTHRVAEREPNGFGLYDMHGNVWEWCHDFADSKAYRERVEFEEDPQFSLRDRNWARDLENPEETERQIHVMRGGSWRSSPGRCRSGYRDRDWRANSRLSGVGFRVALIPNSL